MLIHCVVQTETEVEKHVLLFCSHYVPKLIVHYDEFANKMNTALQKKIKLIVYILIKKL